VTASDAERFKRRGEECRSAAERASTDHDKEGWLRLAAEWDKLTQSAVRQSGIFERHG
jgi:hypothetical protein